MDLQGKVIFDSKQEEQEEAFSVSRLGTQWIEDEKTLNRIKKLEPSLEELSISKRNFIEIVQPYVEEWGRHQGGP